MSSVDVNTTVNSVNAVLNTKYNPECESDYDTSVDNMVGSIASNTLDIERKNTILHIGNRNVGLLIDCGNVCSILNETLATNVIKNSSFARWLTTATSRDIENFANEPIPVIGMMQTPIESNGWQNEDAEIVVVRDGLKPLIGRNLFQAYQLPQI